MSTATFTPQHAPNVHGVRLMMLLRGLLNLKAPWPKGMLLTPEHLLVVVILLFPL